MATYNYDGTSWIGYNEYDTALEIVQKSKNNILYLESLHNTGMIEEELQQIRNQLNEVRTELASLEMRTESIEETLPLKQDVLSAGLAIGIYGTTIAVKLQDIATKLDSVPTGAAITTSSADLIRVENKLYYKTETSVGGMTTYAYEELTNSELTERIVAQIPTDFKIDENGRLILVHDSNVIGAGVEIGGIGVTIDAPATATQGTLTATQLGILEASETNYIMFNNEKYYLMDKQHTSGSLTYSHVGADNQINHIKTFTITLSNLTWVLIDTEVGKSEPAITAVDSLPTPTEEEFEKHKIYLDGAVLKYIAKETLQEPNIELFSTLSANREKIGTAIVGNFLYTFGGMGSSDSTKTNEIAKFNILTGEREILSITLPEKKAGITAVAFGENIFLFGGSATNYEGSIYKFNTISETLVLMNSVTAATGFAFGYAIDQYIFIGGGSSNITGNKRMYKYDPINDSIEEVLTSEDIDGFYLSSALIGKNIYIIDSTTYGTGVLKIDTLNYTITSTNITLPRGASGAATFAINNTIYVCGGRTASLAFTNTIIKIDTDSMSVETLTSTLPNNLECRNVAIKNEKAFLVGGRTASSTYTNKILEIEFGFIFQYKTITAQ